MVRELGRGAFPKLAEGFELHKVIERKNLNLFTWDEHGSFWTLHGERNRLFVEKAGSPISSHSFKRRGNHHSNLLVEDGKLFVSDDDMIRVFQKKGDEFVENPSLVPPRDLFPLKPGISSLRWSPLGHIDFSFQDAPGIGEFDPHKSQWDILTKGIDLPGPQNIAASIQNLHPASVPASKDLLRLYRSWFIRFCP